MTPELKATLSERKSHRRYIASSLPFVSNKRTSSHCNWQSPSGDLHDAMRWWPSGDRFQFDARRATI